MLNQSSVSLTISIGMYIVLIVVGWICLMSSIVQSVVTSVCFMEMASYGSVSSYNSGVSLDMGSCVVHCWRVWGLEVRVLVEHYWSVVPVMVRDGVSCEMSILILYSWVKVLVICMRLIPVVESLTLVSLGSH